MTSESVADMLWDEHRMPPDPPASVRKERSRLRKTLQRLVPDAPSDPLPGNPYKGEKIVVLDPAVVASDIHEFVELLNVARGLGRTDAIEAYEAALALYRGDLLDASDMRKYRWMYDADPQIALDRRAELRALHRDARLKLAGLLAECPESGLARAEQLYTELCGEELDNEHLWTALFRIYERTENSLGLESAVRRFRDAQVELSTSDVNDRTASDCHQIWKSLSATSGCGRNPHCGCPNRRQRLANVTERP